MTCERILTAPYEDRDGWELNVMCIDDMLYFEEHISDQKLRERSVFVTRLFGKFFVRLMRFVNLGKT